MSDVPYQYNYTQMADGFNRRRCAIFTDYGWNSNIYPSNNITSYYFRAWMENRTLPAYSGLGGYVGIIRYYDYYTTSGGYDDIWNAFNDSKSYSVNIKENGISPSVFQYTGSATRYFALVWGYKTGFNIDVSNDILYDIAFEFKNDGSILRPPSQYFNMYMHAFVIFNLPDNATLQGLDTDGDGLNDFNELFLNITDPFSNDTDGDGMPDKLEIDNGFNPNLYNNHSTCYRVDNYENTNWAVNCTCGNITSNHNLNFKNISFVDTGTVNLFGNLNNITRADIKTTCKIYCHNTSCISIGR
jgi:hypothetical protein